jgi:hypothetical protein
MGMHMSIKWCRTPGPAAAVLLVALAACDSRAPATPTAPAQTAPTSPTGPVRYRASGTVTDQAGAAMAGASIQIGVRWSPGRPGGSSVYTATDAAGRYELDFEPNGLLGNVPNAVAEIIAYAAGYQANQQYLMWGVADAVKDLRLRLLQTVDAGQSLTVSIEPDHSICSDQEDWLLPEQRCVNFQVRTASAGTLTVAAHSTEDGAPVPIVFSATTGWYRVQKLGPGTVSLFEVRAGETYNLYVGIPHETAPQRYTVSTSVQ